MWIRNVNFPPELIEAYRSDSLVIFVGAGASIGPPSSLPDFSRLVREIAEQTEREPPRNDEPLDRYLGLLEKDEVDVHGLVARRIGDPASSPNRLHTALVDLALGCRTPRIVTTNYDLHLSTVLRERGSDVEEYSAPAVPMGDDFSGIVYLHGRLGRPPRQLVVTDSDFGRAYLLDAWAARFLERMFATYTVLFVGYSHDDVVMRYLGRALGPGASRYLLTSKGDSPEWRLLGVDAIQYSVVDGSHAELDDAIERWAKLASMGVLEHQSWIRELVSVPPSLIPEEGSYLEDVLADPRRVRLFTNLAQGTTWLDWASTQAEFRGLFDPLTTGTECSPHLAQWFTERFVTASEELSQEALGVLRALGGQMSPTLWNALGRQLSASQSDRPSWLDPWILILIDQAPVRPRVEWEPYILAASTGPAHQRIALRLLDHLTEPRVMLARPRWQARGVSFDVDIRGDGYWLEVARTAVFAPFIADSAPALLAIVERQLRRARDLTLLTGVARDQWDPIFAYRSSIVGDQAPRQPRRPIEALVDIARDALLEVTGSEHGHRVLASWLASDVPVLRRLALYAWARRSDVDGTMKLVELRRGGWLLDRQLLSEAFEVLESAVRSASQDSIEEIVDEILAWPAADEAVPYLQLSVLEVITRLAPTVVSAATAFAAVQLEYPDLVVGEPPHGAVRFEFHAVEPRPVMTTVEFHAAVLADPAAALQRLRQYEHIQFPSDGPTWYDALGLVSGVTEQHPDAGFAILDATEGLRDVVAAVIAGWSKAEVGDEMADEILERLADLNLGPVVDDITRLLAEGGTSEGHPTAWYRRSAARRLADAAWDSAGEESADG